MSAFLAGWLGISLGFVAGCAWQAHCSLRHARAVVARRLAEEAAVVHLIDRHAARGSRKLDAPARDMARQQIVAAKVVGIADSVILAALEP